MRAQVLRSGSFLEWRLALAPGFEILPPTLQLLQLRSQVQDLLVAEAGIELPRLERLEVPVYRGLGLGDLGEVGVATEAGDRGCSRDQRGVGNRRRLSQHGERVTRPPLLQNGRCFAGRWS